MVKRGLLWVFDGHIKLREMQSNSGPHHTLLSTPPPLHTCADAATGGSKAQQHVARQRLQRAQDGHHAVGLHKQALQLAAGEAGDKGHQ